MRVFPIKGKGGSCLSNPNAYYKAVSGGAPVLLRQFSEHQCDPMKKRTRSVVLTEAGNAFVYSRP